MAKVRLYLSEWAVWEEGDYDWACELDVPDELLMRHRAAKAGLQAAENALDELRRVQQPSWF